MMSKSCAPFFRPVHTPVRALGLGLAVAMISACGTSDTETASRDALSRDLSLAGAASETAPPIAFGDTAASEVAPAPVIVPKAPPVSAPVPTPAPQRARAPRPRPTPVPEPVPVPEPAPDAVAPAPAPEPTRRTLLASGTEFVGATGARVCNTTNRPGDRVVMRLASPVTGPDGFVFAAGTPVLLELASATDSTLVFRVKSVSLDGELYPITASARIESGLEGVRVSSGNERKKVIGGAILGAILGQMIGKDTKGAVIGAAGGAAAGAAVARVGGSSERCLPAGGTVRVVLEQPLIMTGPGL